MVTVKLSWTILNQWAMNNFEEAIGLYLGKDIPVTPAMELGKVKHKIYENYTRKTKELHPDFGGGLLLNPIVEQKYQKIIPFSDDIQILIRGIIDLEHSQFGGMLEDYKITQSSASQHVDSHQLGYYKLLRPNARVGAYRCFNPYTGTVTLGVKFLTQKVAEDALEHILTFGGEMIQYLQANKLLKDYKI